ncbi:hypothetical protein CYMTET_13997 [Cymbomonas tetramitiformis]|uniref:Uncharacterized protein n=1 Tax=Cymbomonas tetramitiformis TaxID=36881 RepID=A0AAE0GHE4_9CHLO|nr:hypothetical protein CYMTET_13997 [Cymbomonas tetramitiformis]
MEAWDEKPRDNMKSIWQESAGSDPASPFTPDRHRYDFRAVAAGRVPIQAMLSNRPPPREALKGSKAASASSYAADLAASQIPALVPSSVLQSVPEIPSTQPSPAAAHATLSPPALTSPSTPASPTTLSQNAERSQHHRIVIEPLSPSESASVATPSPSESASVATLSPSESASVATLSPSESASVAALSPSESPSVATLSPSESPSVATLSPSESPQPASDIEPPPSTAGVSATSAVSESGTASLSSDVSTHSAVDSLPEASLVGGTTPSPTSRPQACAADDALQYNTSADNCAFNFRINCSATRLAMQHGNEEFEKKWKEAGSVEFCDTDLARQFARQKGCIFVEDGEFRFRSECASMALPKFFCTGGKQCAYSGKWKSWDTWQLAEPSYHLFSKSEAFRLVAKRRVAFLGDSLGRQVFNHLVQFLRGNSQYADVPQMDHLFYKITAAGANSEDGVSSFTDSFIMRSKTRHAFSIPMTRTADAHFEFLFLFVRNWVDIPDYFNASNPRLQMLKQFDPDVVFLHTGAWNVPKNGCHEGCPVQQQGSFEIIKQYYADHPNTTNFYLLGAPDQRKDQTKIMEMNEASREFCETTFSFQK